MAYKSRVLMRHSTPHEQISISRSHLWAADIMKYTYVYVNILSCIINLCLFRETWIFIGTFL